MQYNLCLKQHLAPQSLSTCSRSISRIIIIIKFNQTAIYHSDMHTHMGSSYSLTVGLGFVCFFILFLKLLFFKKCFAVQHCL